MRPFVMGVTKKCEALEISKNMPQGLFLSASTMASVRYECQVTQIRFQQL